MKKKAAPCSKEQCKFFNATIDYCNKFNSLVYPYAKPLCNLPLTKRGKNIQVDKGPIIKYSSNGERTITTCFFIPDVMFKELNKLAVSKNVTRSKLVNDAIKALLNNEELANFDKRNKKRVQERTQKTK